MGGTVSKPRTKSDLDKNRRLRSSATVGCEKNDEEGILKPAVVDGNHNFKKRRKMRLSALLPQQLNNRNDTYDIYGDGNVNNYNSSQQPQQQQKTKKKLKGKKHNVKSISVKRNAKYKRVTKSIIGKPSNFQHMGHVGADQQFTPRTIRHPDNRMLAEQLHDITTRINSLGDEGGDDQITIQVSPSTPTSSSFNQRQQQTKVGPLSEEDRKHNQHNQNKDPEQQYNQPRQQQQNIGPPPSPPAHWSSLALRQAMRRQQQINNHKKLLKLQQQQQQQLMQQKQNMQQQQHIPRIPESKVTSMKRRNNPVNSKRGKQRTTGRRPRANHVSPNLLGMPPSLRLGPAR
ncbi:hypothetical protein INT45_006417 [Circinella minor]|uniref:CRIB domain-containing protein n=1 Tax=Circinella minor TaxID=1195481 RepID=A0A8H7SEA7_9FUNG|nr:hypothetical protein INT45_006417 [Circinella minor]